MPYVLRYSDEELLEHLRAALGSRKKLTVRDYKDYMQRSSASSRVPSANTIVSRFGKWTTACEQAGIPSGTAPEVSQDRGWGITLVDLALAKFFDGIDYRPTYRDYTSWASGRDDAPSGWTVLSRYELWSNVVDKYLDEELVLRKRLQSISTTP